MGKAKARQLNGAQDLLDSRDLVQVSEDFVTSWIEEKSGPSLLRGSLNQDSQFEFVEDVKRDLARELDLQGLAGALSVAMIPVLLAAPGFAVNKRVGPELQIRQAVLINRSETAVQDLIFDALLVLDAWVLPRHHSLTTGRVVPPEVIRTTVQLKVIDMENDAQVGDVLTELIRWNQELNVPNVEERHLTPSVLFLGNPLELGSAGTPKTWRQELESLTRLFGMKAIFGSGAKFTGDVKVDTKRSFRFDPYCGEKPCTANGGLIETIDFQTRIMSYPEMFQQIALVLVELVSIGEPLEDQSRELGPGELVFHRKIGNSRAFDRFDVGSSKPCVHGAAGYKRFDGPKSLKGFRRRYPNFKDDWMYHCGRYPNCGMYAVFPPS